jgi:hypothetical protein
MCGNRSPHIVVQLAANGRVSRAVGTQLLVLYQTAAEVLH